MPRDKTVNVPAETVTVTEEIVTIHHYISVGRVTAVVHTGAIVGTEFVRDNSVQERNCPIDEGDYEDLVKLKPDKQFKVDDLWPFIDRIDAEGHKPKVR